MIHRISSRIVIGAAVVVGAWLLWPRPSAANKTDAGEPIPAPGEAHARYFGVASCSAMACHNFNGPKGFKGSEFSTWATADRHAKAFAVLSESRSNEMVKKLYPGETKPATETELCLKCHSTFTGKYDEKTKVMADAGPRFRIEDGVACEACHGPAKGYLTDHYQTAFKNLTPAQKKEKGWIETKDLGERARACAQCHVGDGSREVNHDLIAAGHPRLNFELGAYHGIMQKHWDDKKKGPNGELLQPEFEARLWLVGQLSTARSALELLAVRAEGAEKKPWPEFAEYACYACHKDLPVKPIDQLVKPEGRAAGSLPYGTWYMAMVPQAAERVDMKHGTAVADKVAAVRKLMEQAAPDAKAVAGEARDAVKLLDKVILDAGSTRLDAARIKGCLAEFAQDGAKGADKLNWDQAAQLYLGMAAHYQALSDLKDSSATPATRAAMRTVKDRLRGAFPKEYDSPKNYDPLKPPTLGEQLKVIDNLLGK